MARRIMLNGTSYFGQGAIQEIVNEIKNRHFKKVLVTSTPDLFEFKVATKVTDLLDAAGIAYDVYDNIKPNPTIENVTSGVAACKAAGADVIVAVGGGSAIDTSKAIATIMTNPDLAMCVVLRLGAYKTSLLADYRCVYYIRYGSRGYHQLCYH